MTRKRTLNAIRRRNWKMDIQKLQRQPTR